MSFTQVPNEALSRMTEISAGALRLYLFLLQCRNQRTGKCCPSVRVTAEAIGVHPKNIFKLRNELAKAEWASFDGDRAIRLLGVKGSKKTTADTDIKEDNGESSKNATIIVENIEVEADGSKNATLESQKRYPAVAKTLLNGSKNATAYKEEQYEGTILNEQDELIPVAVAPGCGLTSKECFALFVELRQSIGGYEAPYEDKTADFVLLAKLVKKSTAANWPITRERFTQAAKNYFATPQGAHTAADLASRFSEFYKNAHNEFKRPTKTNDPLDRFSPAARGTIAAAEAWLQRTQEEGEL